MSVPFLGEIIMFAGNFAPRGYALCNGQAMAISQNDALFALLGTIYGGDGIQTFNLPDLRGRVPIHQGTGSGLPTYTIGEVLGNEQVTLLSNQLPAHTHQAQCTNNTGTSNTPQGNIWATDSSGATAEYDPPAGASLNGNAIGAAGNSIPHNNIQPSLAISFCIALEGIFPSQN